MLHIDTFQPNHLIIYLLSGVDVGVDTDVDVLTRPTCLVLILVDCVLKKSCYRLSINVKKQTILS